MAIKSIFAKALFLGCASLVSHSVVPAQEIFTPVSEELNDHDELVAGVRVESKSKAPMSNSSVSPDRSPVPEPVPMPALVTVSSKFGGRRTVLAQAYNDAFNILSGANRCSALLGGRQSITALNGLVSQLGMRNLRSTVAMQMSGPTTTFQSHATGFTYRLFSSAYLNVDGLFFRGNFMNQQRVPSIGGFAPNTREARVTVLLHELGHLVKGSDKRWLLQDDGDDELMSVANTGRILEACRESINQLADPR